MQKLTSLLQWGNLLTGLIPGELANCSALVVPDLSTNKLSGEIPGELGSLGLFEQFHLSDNLLTGPVLAGISNKNKISGPILWEIGELKFL